MESNKTGRITYKNYTVRVYGLKCIKKLIINLANPRNQPSSTLHVRGTYGSNFIASLRALSVHCEQHGWAFILALPADAAEKGWCVQLIADGYQVYFLPKKASVLRYSCELAN
jgi:hypothetical protein